MNVLDFSPRCEREAAKYGVHSVIHPKDFIFHHLLNLPNIPDPIENYFSDGRNSANTLKHVLFSTLNYPKHDFSLLDFASGYGMVARHLPVVFPQANVTTCDIHPEANEFNATNIRVNSLQSTPLPDQLAMDRKFNVVFALSFFSHLSGENFALWLSKLYSLVESGGLLIFTTHGRWSARDMIIEDDTLYFEARSEQKDLDASLYGVSCVAPTYVMKLIRQLEKPPLSAMVPLFQEGFWWSHQDLYVVQKPLL